MSERIWYLATCTKCGERIFDRKEERDLWAAQHVLSTGDSFSGSAHLVLNSRTKTPPMASPTVNCYLCIQLGTHVRATHKVYEYLVCSDHVTLMQTSSIDDAIAAVVNTKAIGKQED